MNRLRKAYANMEEAPAGGQKAERAQRSWRRLMIALFLTISSIRQEMVTEYLHRRIPQPEDTEKTKEPKEPARKTKDPNYKIRQAIGAPLTRSTAQKSWNKTVDECIHEEEYLRHRASKGHYWFTCLQCGGRWERLEAAASSSTQIVETATRASYPTFLPPPRSRPDLPTYRVLVKPVTDATTKTSTAMARASTMKTRGRSAERLDGLNPVQRSKTPSVGPTCKPLRTAAIEVFQMANEADPNEFDMPEFSPEEIAQMNAEAYMEIARQGMGEDFWTATEEERHQFLEAMTDP